MSKVNPDIIVYKNETFIFDLSDSSLSYSDGSQSYPAFDFNLYLDSNFKNIFESSKSSVTPEVEKNGIIGVTTNAYLKLSTNNEIPRNLFYNITPSKKDENPFKNLSLIYDDENITSNNSITLSDSLYSGQHVISGVASTAFEYNITKYPERSSYAENEATVKYTTNSNTSYGPISEIRVKNSGVNYNFLPGISSVFSNFGTGAILDPFSDSIGKIANTRIEDIGFEYSVDTTVRPVTKLPQILKVLPLSSI